MSQEFNNYCYDLNTKPCPETGTILVTGASGYIGGRLVSELYQRGYQVRVMVRVKSPSSVERWPYAEIVQADALDYESLKRALRGVSIAYYLIHSLALGTKTFEEADIKAAINFRKAAEENHLKRIIYLGGLGDFNQKLSKHLNSRIRVASELQKGRTPVTVLRAAIIIGSGSASFEIIKNLVKNTFVIPIPKWAQTNCQPISIRDVIKYLVGTLETEETSGKTFDIGGKNYHSYKDMLKICAALLGKKRIFFNSFFHGYRFYGYLASLITPVPFPIVLALFEGASNEVVCKEHSISDFIEMEPLSYSEAVILALESERQDKIVTRWSDAYPPAHELEPKLSDFIRPTYSSSYSLITDKEAKNLFKAFCKVGGKEGWFNTNWMWRLRGFIDRILLGIGSIRGRRSINSIRINDVIDFWRIEDIVRDKRLLLRAEMKLPGKAWLEFKIDELPANKNRLSVHAYFFTKSFWGKIYWYIFLPFHKIIFSDLIKQIEARS